MHKMRWASIGALAFALFAVLAGPAAARDRNHDRIPDRWEKRHHLSLKVNQARRDQDSDGLRNRAEFKARLDPRDADTDNDGVEDGDENAGTVQSFENGVLTIALFGGGTVSGDVTDATEIECDDAHASDHGDDPSGDDRGDDNEEQGDNNDDQGDDNDDQGEDDDENQACGTADLTTGRRVHEAELRLSNGHAVFRKIELAP